MGIIIEIFEDGFKVLQFVLRSGMAQKLWIIIISTNNIFLVVKVWNMYIQLFKITELNASSNNTAKFRFMQELEEKLCIILLLKYGAGPEHIM